MSSRTLSWFAGALAATFASPLSAQTVELGATKDCTLYQRIDGQWANGMGHSIHAGRTRDNGRRRALLAFDPAAVLPAGSVILNATLVLECTRAPMVVTPTNQSAHRALVEWEEGPTNAGGPEGIGGTSQPGDSTWFHTFYNTVFWTNPGGDYAPTPSATTLIDSEGTYSWNGPGLTADVQHWLDNPAENFGWLMRGDTEVVQSARRYTSLQGPLVEDRPLLVLEFEGPPVGLVYCPATTNSTGAIGQLRATGSDGIAVNLLRMTASSMPAQVPTILASGRLQAQVPFAGGGQGTLCLGGPLGRFSLQISDANGEAVQDLDLSALPTSSGPGSAMPGETWTFQYWYRDSNPTLTSNFTEAVQVLFQ